MSVNKYLPHLLVVPEDDADRELVVGFVDHFAVNDRFVEIHHPAGGWLSVMEVFEKEVAPYLWRYRQSHAVLILDFDEKDRRESIEKRIPAELKPRVFLLGLADEPEAVQRELGISLVQIGHNLAEDCRKATFEIWGNPHFAENRREVERMISSIKPIIFQDA